MGEGANHRTWNVFRRRNAHGLCCAVPADMPVPTFLLTIDWIFGFQFTHGAPVVPGFSLQAAEVGARFNGFYLFLAFASRTPPSARAAPEALDVDGEPNDALAH